MQELDSSFFTIAEFLSTKGYRTSHIGKWDLGDGPTGPVAQGFDINVGGNNSGKIHSFFSPYENKDIPERSEGEYLTDRLTEEAIDFIGKSW